MKDLKIMLSGEVSSGKCKEHSLSYITHIVRPKYATLYGLHNPIRNISKVQCFIQPLSLPCLYQHQDINPNPIATKKIYYQKKAVVDKANLPIQRETATSIIAAPTAAPET